MVRRVLDSPRVSLGFAAAAALVIGALFMLAPGFVLDLLRIDVPDDVWVRLFGLLVIAVGVLHTAGTIANERWYYVAMVAERIVAGIGQLVLAFTIGPWQIALFGLFDLSGAMWTATALRASSAEQVPASP